MKVLCSVLSLKAPETYGEHPMHQLSLDGSTFSLFNLCFFCTLIHQARDKVGEHLHQQPTSLDARLEGAGSRRDSTQLSISGPQNNFLPCGHHFNKVPASSLVLEPSGYALMMLLH